MVAGGIISARFCEVTYPRATVLNHKSERNVISNHVRSHRCHARCEGVDQEDLVRRSNHAEGEYNLPRCKVMKEMFTYSFCRFSGRGLSTIPSGTITAPWNRQPSPGIMSK